MELLQKTNLHFFSSRALILVLFLFNKNIFSESLRLSLEDAVKNVLENNLIVKNAKMEIAKSDSLTIKNTSKFVWKAFGDVTVFQNILPINNTTLISGNKTSQDKIAAGFEKQYESGTYINLEASSTRFDANAFEGNLAYLYPSFSKLAIKPLYTGAFTVKISQELYKYSFGKVEKNTEKILRTKAVIERDQLVFLLSNLVTKTLIDYWALSIQESSVETIQKLVNNAKFIQNVTIRKKSLGLAEQFEVNLWNSVVSNLESQLGKAKTDRDIAKRELKRILSLDSKIEVTGITDLNENLPSDLNFALDLETALKKRVDLKNIARSIEYSKLLKENAEEEDNPSIKFTATYSTKAQTLYSPQENFILNNYGISTFKYPEGRGELSISYPLWDEGIKEGIRESKINLAQLIQKEADLKKEIENELQNRLDSIYTSHFNLEISKKNLEETTKYYKGITEKFSQGRYTAQNLKIALDSLAQAE
ncbi:MAG: TolC family protein, partial [Spirochaetia bacterium]|nr:TolC family protein [Spirochaetia bacterium]